MESKESSLPKYKLDIINTSIHDYIYDKKVFIDIKNDPNTYFYNEKISLTDEFIITEAKIMLWEYKNNNLHDDILKYNFKVLEFLIY